MQELPPPGAIVTLEDGSRLMSRPKSGGMGQLEAVRLPKAGQCGDHLEMWGEAHIRNGPGLCMVPGCGCGEAHQVARNKIVGQALRHIINALYVGGATLTGSGTPSATVAYANTVSNTFNVASDGGMSHAQALGSTWIYVGTGSGATLDATVALSAAVATKPDSTSRALTNPSAGLYRLALTATWNSGSITAETVTEIGVYASLNATLGNNYTGANRSNGALFARLSVTDSEFSSFVINTAAPLVIEYQFNLTFT